MTESSDIRKFLLGALLLAIGVAGVPQQVSAQAWKKPEWITPAAEAPGLSQQTFHSEAVGRSVSYHIYTPAEYESEGDRRFPVLYWLHGSAGGEGAVPNLTRILDAAMREGQMPPMLVVYPNGLELSFWLDSKDGRVPMETVVMEELVPHIDTNYRTIASREGRVVEGFSMGGYGAARLGFKFHHVFGAVSILAGGPLQREFTHAPRATEERRQMVLDNIYGGDHAYFTKQSPWVLAEDNADALRERTRIRLVIGDQDEMLEVVREFHEHLLRLDIPHDYVELPGVGHEPGPSVRALGQGLWAFYAPTGL